MKPEALLNMFYQLFDVLKADDTVESIRNNTKLIKEIISSLPNSVKKQNFDLTISFVYDKEQLFSINSAEVSHPVFRADIREMELKSFIALLYGQIKASEYLANAFFANKETDFFPNHNISLSSALSSLDYNWEEYLNRVAYIDERFFVIDEVQQARELLRKNHVVWCHNKSCTGKTFLGINTLNNLGIPCFAFNPNVNKYNNVCFLSLALEHATDCALLIDDLQCDVDSAKYVLDYLQNNLASVQERNLFVFIVSWSSLINSPEFCFYADSIPVMTTKPQKCIALMKERIPNRELLDICGDSLSLVNTLSDIVCDNPGVHSVLFYKEKLFFHFVKTKKQDQINLVYILSVLGTFEIETPKGFLSRFGRLDLSILPTAKVQDNQIFLAHRKDADFIARFIEKNYDTPLSRVTIVKQYVSSIDSNKKWKVLTHLIGDGDPQALASVSPLWKLMFSFRANLQEQTAKDPTWNNTPSSMFFVLSTANMLGVVDEYINVVDALCKHITVANGKVLIDYDALTTTSDFGYIRDRMIQEDSLASQIPYEKAIDIDTERTHRNWLLGLIVGLKPVLVEYGHSNLIQAAEQELIGIQDIEGFWYPKRIPWVTARILIGLATAGYTGVDDCIKRGVNYLYSASKDNHWVAHTGGWNNEYETTSLCLEALIKCGEESDSSKMKAIGELLLCKSDTWMKPEYDIDGTTSACALMKIFGVDQQLLSYVHSLAERNIHEIVDSSDSLDYSQVQSCKVTQIAYYVIELCWYLLERDIPNLLEKFIARSEIGGDSVQRKKVFISYLEEHRTIDRIRKIANRLSDDFTVYFYDNAPLGTNLPEFMNKIEDCDAILVMGTKGYKAKATTLRRGGVWYEYCVLSQEFMNEHYSKIVPIAFDEFSDSFPAIFNANKGMRAKRVDERFINSLSEKLKNKLEEDTKNV